MVKKTKDITAEELVEVLRFTPRTYRVEIGNYGGEVYAGRVARKVYDYFKQRKIDLDDYANDWDNELNVPEEFQPFPPGSPYDCDDLVHASGATMDDGNLIQVFDENGDVVWECALNLNTLDDEGVECNEWETFDSDEMADGDVVYWGAQGDKGLCFGGEIELKAPFDPKKLKLNYSNADGWLICNGVEYNGEDIDNNDLSTTGKWGENKWLINGEEIYESVNREDLDEEELAELDNSVSTVPESACSSEEWDPAEELDKIVNENLLTDWFPMDVKPVHRGEYECEFLIATWPWPSVRMCEWTGRTWKDSDGGKIKGDFKWRGLQAPAAEYITIED